MLRGTWKVAAFYSIATVIAWFGPVLALFGFLAIALMILIVQLYYNPMKQLAESEGHAHP
jgi:predicted membrane protein